MVKGCCGDVQRKSCSFFVIFQMEWNLTLSAHFFLHVCEKSQLNWNVWSIHTKSPQMFLTAKLIS